MVNRAFLPALLLAALSLSAAPNGVLAEHDYDPLGDKVAALRIDAATTAGQSFVPPSGAEASVALRLKILRAGSPGTLEYRIGTTPGGSQIAQGTLPPEAVTPLFETWVQLDLHGARLTAGQKTFVWLAQSGGAGHYEAYGTDTAGEEGPINLDYGWRTKGYADGEAYGPGGQAQPAVDLAFQLIPAGFAPKTEEPFAFLRELNGPIQYRRARFANARPAAGEIRLDNTWRIQPPAAAPLVVRTAIDEFERFLAGAMNVRLTGSAKSITLKVNRTGLTKPEAFRLEITPAGITVNGYDDRALMRGLYHLQDLMDLRQAPLLKAGTILRSPRYSPRITCGPLYAGEELKPDSDPYTDGMLARISHSGFDAIFVWSKLYQVGRSAALPELASEADVKLARLNAIVDRAAKYGIDVYAYVTLDPLPASFFDNHPDARGVARNFNSFYGQGNLLCTSAPVVQRYIQEATASLFRGAPGIKGAILVPLGEGLYNCRTYPKVNTCPRCSNRHRDDVIAELIGLIAKGAHSVNPKASVVTWTYTWPDSDPARAELIPKLPKDTIWLQTFDKEGLIQRDGVTDIAYDYAISLLGPSENLKLQLPLVKKAGLPLWIKTEAMISQEYVQTPYIPIPQRFIERYRRIAQYPQTTGIFLNWCHNGYQPSRVVDLVKWYTWDPMPEGDSIVRQMAQRDFGDQATPIVVNAWNRFSQAIGEYPLSDNTSRNGPFQKGPAHPFFWDEAYQPKHHEKRQFFNSLEWTQPWDVAITAKYFRRMETGWAEGVRLLQQAVAMAAPEDRREARRELGIATMQLSCLRMALNLIDFIHLRRELATTTDRPAVIAKMRTLLEAERANSLMALEYVDEDSRLGYTNGGNGITNGGVRAGIFTAGSIRKKLAQIDHLLNVELPRAASVQKASVRP